MVESLVGLIILLLVGGLVWYLFTMVLALMPIPPPVKQVINIIGMLILVLIVIGWFFGGVSLPHSRFG